MPRAALTLMLALFVASPGRAATIYLTGDQPPMQAEGDAVCPGAGDERSLEELFPGSTSPDVVYSHSPDFPIEIDIDLCESDYDTKVYVYENSTTTLVACNDDACGADGFRSQLTHVPTNPGNTYYIVVDGYGGACGEYLLGVSQSQPCLVTCPPGGFLEGEPDCYDGYEDTTNDGCGGDPPAFTTVPCDPYSPVTICGTYGGYFYPAAGINYRDTDWYELSDIWIPDDLTVCVIGELETLFGYIDADTGCEVLEFEDYMFLEPCVEGCLNLPYGNYWIWVGTRWFGPEAGPCGSNYTMTVSGGDCAVLPVEPTSWARIKAKYIR